MINKSLNNHSSFIRVGGNYFETPKIGLALGSGGARGFAHLGVIKVLEKKEFRLIYCRKQHGIIVACFYEAD